LLGSTKRDFKKQKMNDVARTWCNLIEFGLFAGVAFDVQESLFKFANKLTAIFNWKRLPQYIVDVGKFD